MITFDRPTPTFSILSPTSSPSTITLPDYILPPGLPEPFEAPNLIIPFDKADPTKRKGNGLVAQISPATSTVFVYDVRSVHAGKMCTMAFLTPPPSEFPDLAPYRIRTPGGISVFHSSTQAGVEGDIGGSTPIGGVASLQPGQQYNIATTPCEAGQRVAYQVESIYGLNMDWFQMTNPPLGLFMLVN